ncbi:MAG: hypothetical protein ACR2G7_00725 [Acidimicrobiales bacterium]
MNQLEVDSGDRGVRRLRFRAPGLWCVPVVVGHEEWAILWEPHPDEPEAVIVQYVRPATFS